MFTVDDFKSSLTDRLITGKSMQGNLFKQVAGDLAKQALGIASQPVYENQTQIYFTDPQTQESLQIPVLPPKITIKWERQTETVNILNLGEVDFTTGKKLQEISFSSFFPIEYTPTYCRYADIPDPATAYMTLDGWCAAQNTDYVPDRPVRLMITGTSLNINMLVLISNLETEDRGGEPGDIYYSLSCREWREIKVRTEAEQYARNNRPNPKPKPKIVQQKIKSGDTVQEFLYKIAKQHYGNGQDWNKVYNMNKAKLQGNLTKKAIDLVL
ncbi:LysM peptidoglycan-binding domain-containing protein [Propionispora vibrioides]|uniref:LysM domain-containing protein n=1 Tax=Propionispora vibrioides TaxID=112903 RepID=A0A1H8U727_9FIRM|nr:hypothetical protein [Propionispora vibrioides]SEO98644.1 hypothetical protein SAMN04490178_10846 [Propionispora vibrioides]